MSFNWWRQLYEWHCTYPAFHMEMYQDCPAAYKEMNNLQFLSRYTKILKRQVLDLLTTKVMQKLHQIWFTRFYVHARTNFKDKPSRQLADDSQYRPHSACRCTLRKKSLNECGDLPSNGFRWKTCIEIAYNFSMKWTCDLSSTLKWPGEASLGLFL